MSQELRAHGKRALSIDEAKTLFEQHGSTAPMTASAADIDELARDAQRALYHVASGLPARAKADVQRALERARRALESLNRETRAAQHLLDACLFLVRAHLQHGNRPAARNQALECRRLVPDILPDGTVHPPDVIGVFAEAQAELLAHEPAALRIESEPTGCAAYVNGRNLGPTPKELSQLSPGEYRLQVECDPGLMGRVHRVALANIRVVIAIDTRYDRAIETLFDLSLSCGSDEQAAEHASRDAVVTARVVGATDVILATSLSAPGVFPARVRLDRFRVADGVPLARAVVLVSVEDKRGVIAEADLEAARAALTTKVGLRAPASSVAPAQQPSELPAVEPVAAANEAAIVGDANGDRDDTAPQDLWEPENPAEPSQAWPIVGYALGGLAVASYATGWVLYAGALDQQQAYADALNANAMPEIATTDELTALGDVDQADDPPIIAGAIGGALSAASVPLWLPKSEGIPWWGWTAGASGLVVAATGGALALGEGGCELDRFGRCTEPAQATHLGAMLMLQAVPLLAVPLVQGIRSLTSERLDVTVSARGTNGALLRIEGRL
ncbi:MAG TPA: PEGA domain-containing protein [Polyangiales bacterium]|nr:PEGA domain-containing protein [Polyangiales bacterium]